MNLLGALVPVGRMRPHHDINGLHRRTPSVPCPSSRTFFLFHLPRASPNALLGLVAHHFRARRTQLSCSARARANGLADAPALDAARAHGHAPDASSVLDLELLEVGEE